MLTSTPEAEPIEKIISILFKLVRLHFISLLLALSSNNIYEIAENSPQHFGGNTTMSTFIIL
jgi:hypothetical protein